MSAAQQIYDYIDQHIRRLDKDLRTFDVGAPGLGYLRLGE